MKGLTRTAAFVLFLCLGFSGLAQVPGYMGKKFTVGYGLYANPALLGLATGATDSPLNTLHTFFLEAATGKKVAIGLNMQMYRSTYNNVESVDAFHSNSSMNSQLDQHPSGSYKIQGRNYQLSFKFFKSRYLAPWGRYFLMGLTLNKYQTSYVPDEIRVMVQEKEWSPVTQRYEAQQRYITDFGPATQSFSKVDLFFGNGNSRIFANSIVLDYGYVINTIAFARVFFDISDPVIYSYPEEYIESTAVKRVAAINRFNFFVKLGYLF